MAYIVAIVILILFIKFYLNDKSFSKKKITPYLNAHNLSYLNHATESKRSIAKKKFDEDVNPISNVLYAVQYYVVNCLSDENKEIKVYVKWYRSRSLFTKSKAYFKRQE